MYREWIRALAPEQREAITEAAESGSLGKVRRALRLLRDSRAERRPFRVEILSSQNLEPLLPQLEFALSCLPSDAQVRLGPLDDIEGWISRSGEQARAGSDARIVIWRIEEVLPEALLPVSHGFPQVLAARVEQVRERVERVVSLHQKHAPGIPFFVSTLAVPAACSNRLFQSQHRAGLFSSIARINERIYEEATRHGGVHVLDLAEWSAEQGAGYADPLLDLMARQPLSAPAQLSFCFFLARTLRPLLVPRRKVLALDLDHTLWGGVIAEDGVEGLALGHDFPGNVHLRIQRELLELRARGILLVLLSKNNEADARLGFDAHPEMLLKWDDFVVRKVDWNHKHQNLREAARELSLGVDSFVFLDDSDYEREQMRQAFPEVLILNNDGGDALQMLRSLWHTDAFDSLSLTSEDLQRHHDYAVRAARKVEGHGDDLQGFLESLEMQVSIETVNASNLDRVVTMLGKTNQFNVTTRRHSRAEVQGMIKERRSVALALRLRDKFGDQGIVATLLAVPGPEATTLMLDSFLVSCRALGRGVEDALWSAMLTEALRHGYETLQAVYVPTQRNQIVANLFDRLGMARSAEQGDGVLSYMLQPVRKAEFPPWIQLTAPNHAN